MDFSAKTKITTFVLLLFINILMRIQVVNNEIGADSFQIHVLANSISEYGYGVWITDTLSFFGLSPYSYSSAVPFLLSGIQQISLLNGNNLIFIYSLILGILSVFVSYVGASAIRNDYLSKYIFSFLYSLSPAVLNYTTMTVPTRSLIIVLAPIVFFLMVKYQSSKKIKYLLAIISFYIFFFVTHHLVYFIFLALFSFFIALLIFNFVDKRIKVNNIQYIYSSMIILGFAFMLMLPMVFGKFLEQSRYLIVLIFFSYIRYVGVAFIFFFGGLVYEIFNPRKNFGEFLFTFSIMFLSAFVFLHSYVRNIFQIFVLPFALVGFYNVMLYMHKVKKERFCSIVFIMFIVSSAAFSGYYQHVNFREDSWRYISDSNVNTATWLKEYTVEGNVVSNSKYDGNRLFAFSERTHFLIDDTLIDAVYGFVNPDLSQFQKYPITSESFWFDVGVGYAYGEAAWSNLHELEKSAPSDYNISYIAESMDYQGYYSWHHGDHASSLLKLANNEGSVVYDVGQTRIWKI